MRSDTLDSVKHLIVRMINEESDEHAELINKLKKRKPPDIDRILVMLGAISNARLDVLEEVLGKLKEMGK